MNLPSAIRTLEAFGMLPLVHHVGEPGQPVNGVVQVDHHILAVNDGMVRKDDVIEAIEVGTPTIGPVEVTATPYARNMT